MWDRKEITGSAKTAAKEAAEGLAALSGPAVAGLARNAPAAGKFVVKVAGGAARILIPLAIKGAGGLAATVMKNPKVAEVAGRLVEKVGGKKS